MEGVPNAKSGDKGGAAGRAGKGLAHEALSGFPLANLKLVHSTIITVSLANAYLHFAHRPVQYVKFLAIMYGSTN